MKPLWLEEVVHADMGNLVSNKKEEENGFAVCKPQRGHMPWLEKNFKIKCILKKVVELSSVLSLYADSEG